MPWRIAIVVLALALPSHSAWGMDPAIWCHTRKIQHAAKYHSCLMVEESKAVQKERAPDYTACEESYAKSWARIEKKAGGACLVHGDADAIQTRVEECTDTLLADIDDDPLPVCGNGIAEPGEDCDWGDLAGKGCRNHGFDAGVLRCTPMTCTFDTSGCLHNKVAFVTYAQLDSSFGGLAAADALCASEAAAGGLSGTFLAWLGDGSSGPSTRFNRTQVRYLRADGELIAASWGDLTDGSLLAPINRYSGGGGSWGVSEEVWTGVTPHGQAVDFVGYNCRGWSGSGTGLLGYSGAETGHWTSSRIGSCDATAALYCFEQ